MPCICPLCESQSCAGRWGEGSPRPGSPLFLVTVSHSQLSSLFISLLGDGKA